MQPSRFRNDATALGIHDQFMWGPAFLISPVLDEAKLSVQAYFPEAKWYSYYDVSLYSLYPYELCSNYGLSLRDGKYTCNITRAEAPATM